MEEVHANATYALRELDGAFVRTPIAGKRMTLFKKRGGLKDDQRLDILFEDFTEEDAMEVKEG